MKKVIIFVIFGLTVFSNLCFSTELVASQAFRTAFTSVVNDSNNLSLAPNPWKGTYTYNTQRILPNSNVVNALEVFGEVSQNSYIGLAPNSEVNKFGYQCVGFIKSATGYSGLTKDWSAVGSKISKTNRPKQWSVIATFDSSGHYDNTHTALVLGSNDYGLFVADQNWEIKTNPGKILLHFLPYNWTGSTYKVNSASNYNVVGY